MTEEAIVATMIVVIALIIGLVSIAKPLIGRLGDIVESYLASRAGEAEVRRELDAVHDQLDRLGDRISLMEERLDFTESLMARERPAELETGPPERREERLRPPIGEGGGRRGEVADA